jgi:predicted DNA-binding transcriptional regulator AlpA
MSNDTNEQWLSRQDLADRYGLLVKTLAQWASKGTGPPYARMGRHVRYRLSDVTAWETARVEDVREAAEPRTPPRRDFEEVSHALSDEVKTGSSGRSV